MISSYQLSISTSQCVGLVFGIRPEATGPGALVISLVEGGVAQGVRDERD